MLVLEQVWPSGEKPIQVLPGGNLLTTAGGLRSDGVP
jgi:hypothetical protein